jgi:peroxiredoxin Q/BCP
MKIGDKVPDLLGIDQDGKEVKRSDYKDRKIALYFYPKDNTGSCTAEACSLRDGYGDMQKAGYEIIGVSKDSAKSHKGFIEKHDLPFRLIADTDTTLQQFFGVWAEKSMYGRKYMGTLRQTFLIDENGIIENIIEKVDTKNSSEQILKIKSRH